MRAHAARSDKIGNEGPSPNNFIATTIPKNAAGGLSRGAAMSDRWPGTDEIYQPL
jgi:hypothetical protein